MLLAISHSVRRAARHLRTVLPEVSTHGPRPSSADRAQDQEHTAGVPIFRSAPPPRTSSTPAAVRGGDPLNVTAGVCLSPRLALLLAPEWRQVALRAENAVDTAGLDLVLLEICQGQVPGWTKDDSRLMDALEHWAELGIPVVAWCTDDSSVSATWLPLLRAVAVTTQARRKQMLQHLDVVLMLPAAAQPRMHRPSGPSSQRQGALAVFDGFSRLADNRDLVEVLSPALSPIAPSDLRLMRVRSKSSTVTLPTALADRVDPSSEWIDLQAMVGHSRVGIDLSAASVQGPWTTMALAGSGLALVGASGLTDELPMELDDLVPRQGDAKALRGEIVARVEQEELAAREGHRLHRAVLSGHTAGHRVRTILQATTIEAPVRRRSVSAIVPTNRTHEIDNILANLGRQSHDDVELVLVLHGLDVSKEEMGARAADAGIAHLTMVCADAALTLGSCMNLGVEAASGAYIAKMDDDNFYGERYLTDLVHAFDYTSAGIVGKWCHYVWLQATGAVVLRYPDSEHTVERRVQGGSMMFDAEVLRGIGFSDIPRAVDSDILDRATKEGVQIYSADRFNFVSIRGSDRHAHTWTVQDSTFMTKTGRLVFYGDPRTHVSV